MKGGIGLREEDEHPDKVSAARKRKQDLDDFHNEIGGRDVGRIRRFLPEDARPDHSGRRTERQSRIDSALMSLLQSDPAYAALYDEVSDTLDKAQGLTIDALANVNLRIDDAAAKLEDMEDGASTLPDGTIVFRDADGLVLTGDGHKLTADELGRVNWKEGAASWEEYRRQKEILQKAAVERAAILKYQHEVLDPARQHLNSDKPPSKEELRELQRRIEDMSPMANEAKAEPETVPDGPVSETSFVTAIPKT